MSGYTVLALLTFAAAAGMVLGGVIIELVEHHRRKKAARSLRRMLHARLNERHIYLERP